MRKLVVDGAKIRCSQGTLPSVLVVLPDSPVSADDKPAASVADHKPNRNLITFGQCRSLKNPAVASATASAAGVLSPQPCVPATNKPWEPGAPFAVVGEIKILTSDSTCTCDYDGTIDILDPNTDASVDSQ